MSMKPEAFIPPLQNWRIGALNFLATLGHSGGSRDPPGINIVMIPNGGKG